jgi:hypothetical protein
MAVVDLPPAGGRNRALNNSQAVFKITRIINNFCQRSVRLPPNRSCQRRIEACGLFVSSLLGRGSTTSGLALLVPR